MSKPNALNRALARIAGLPPALRNRLATFMFTTKVRFAGTGGCQFEALEEGRAVMRMKNRRKVQNHIGGIHAAGMALLAESATGAVFGLTIPDTHLPLLKSMHVDYVKRANGSLRAEATLSPEQRQQIVTEEKGNLVVPVRVTDEDGNEPIQAQMCWAWVPKKRG
jgi:acyl-coenzyme A thioesterase PaaI-like protein